MDNRTRDDIRREIGHLIDARCDDYLSEETLESIVKLSMGFVNRAYELGYSEGYKFCDTNVQEAVRPLWERLRHLDRDSED